MSQVAVYAAREETDRIRAVIMHANNTQGEREIERCCELQKSDDDSDGDEKTLVIDSLASVGCMKRTLKRPSMEATMTETCDDAAPITAARGFRVIAYNTRLMCFDCFVIAQNRKKLTMSSFVHVLSVASAS